MFILPSAEKASKFTQMSVLSKAMTASLGSWSNYMVVVLPKGVSRTRYDVRIGDGGSWKSTQFCSINQFLMQTSGEGVKESENFADITNANSLM